MTSKKQGVWLEEYLKCWNATEAARRANYTHPNKRGPENLAKFGTEISKRLDDLAMSADEVLARLSEQARCEYAAFIGDNGTVDLAALKAAGKMHLVKGIKETRNGRQVEFYDGQTALVQIGKHHGLFVDRHEHTGADGGPMEVKDVSDDRAAILGGLLRIAAAAGSGTVAGEPEA